MNYALAIPNKQQDEELVFLLRRHWLTFTQRFVGFIILFVIPPAVIIAAWGKILDVIAEQGPGGALTVMVLSLYYLFLGLYLFHAWMDYYLDVWIVTTKRIINIEQRGMFSRVVSELQLDAVEDITVEAHGILPTFFKFGDIHIQTAAERARFHFDDVRNPYDIAKRIGELRDTLLRSYARQPTVPAPPSGSGTPPPTGQRPGGA